MNKLIMIKKHELKQREAEHLLSDISTLEDEINDLLENLEASTDLTIKELEDLEKQVEELKDKILSKKEELKSKQSEIEELERSIEENNIIEYKEDKQEEKRDMTKSKQEVREQFNELVRNANFSKEEIQKRGFTSVEGAAVVPDELLPYKEEKVVDKGLEVLVDSYNVKSGHGKIPVIKYTETGLNSVSELEDNPELSNPTFDEVKYDIETYRGQTSIARELIDDAEVDVVSLIEKQLNIYIKNNRDKRIVDTLKAANKKTVKTLDDLKTILNVDLDPKLDTTLVVSQSFFNEIDKIKDKDGQYILQRDITKESGHSVLGCEVLVYADEVIGTKKGDKVAFVGDLDAFVAFFDRQSITVEWVDNVRYGKVLAIADRFDVQNKDKTAGFYVTLQPIAAA